MAPSSATSRSTVHPASASGTRSGSLVLPASSRPPVPATAAARQGNVRHIGGISARSSGPSPYPVGGYSSSPQLSFPFGTGTPSSRAVCAVVVRGTSGPASGP